MNAALPSKKKKLIAPIGSRIGIRLIGPYLVLSLFTLLIISGLIYHNYTTQMQSITTLQEETALRARAEIDAYFSSLLQGLSLARRDVFCVECENSAENDKILKNLLAENPSILTVSIINAAGQEINKVDRYDAEASQRLEYLAGEEQFIRALRGETYMGEVYTSVYGLPSLSISLPILNNEDKHVGVFHAEVDLSPMWNVISRIRVGETGYVYVVDRTGQLLVYKDIASLREGRDVRTSHGVEKFLTENKDSASYTSFTGSEVIGSWALSETPEWGVIVELPYEEVLASLKPVLVGAVVSLVVFLLSIVILLSIVYRRLLVPIQQIESGVSGVKEGKWDSFISLSTDDEFSDLANTFNQMTHTLKELYEQLEERVKERTRALKAAQEDLEKKVTDLANMNKFMINRELKMVELKREIKSCEIEREKVSSILGELKQRIPNTPTSDEDTQTGGSLKE